MTGHANTPRLPWLASGDPFPEVSQAWGPADPVPGLLASGSDLSVTTLIQAYSQGVFPWFSQGQPTLWWSPNPRMVLTISQFKLHRSLRKTLQAFLQTPGCQVRINHNFSAVIQACANTPRDGQTGTWILPEMQAAYIALHKAGHAHSIETWAHGKLTGGLYCTAIGGAVFGESMFAHTSDASKIALAALVALCRSQGVSMIDCQQNTAHLTSFGAAEISREAFCAQVLSSAKKTLVWHIDSVKWEAIDVRLAS